MVTPYQCVFFHVGMLNPDAAASGVRTGCKLGENYLIYHRSGLSAYIAMYLHRYTAKIGRYGDFKLNMRITGCLNQAFSWLVVCVVLFCFLENYAIKEMVDFFIRSFFRHSYLYVQFQIE